MGINIQSDIECLRELGFEPGADYGDVKKAYRKMAAQCHPDRIQAADPRAAAKVSRFQSLSRAFDQLRSRHGQGYWSSPWDAAPPSAAPPHSKEKKDGKKRRGGREADGSPVINRTSFGSFSFDFLSRGTWDEVFECFFKSYLNAAMGAAMEPKRFSPKQACQEMARAFQIFARTYGFEADRVEWFKPRFLSMAWAQESEPMRAVLERAASQVAKSMGKEGAKLSAALRFDAARIRASHSRFDLLSGICLAPSWRKVEPKTLDFHRAVAERVRPQGGAEDFEFGAEGAAFARPDPASPFLARLLGAKPEVAIIYWRAKWFDFSHACYGLGGLDPLAMVAASRAPAADIAEILLGEEGAVAASARCGSLPPAKARECLAALAPSLFKGRSGARWAVGLPPGLIPQFDPRAKFGRWLWERSWSAAKPRAGEHLAWGSKLMDRIRGAHRAQERRAAKRAFAALRLGDLRSFKDALSDWRSSTGASASRLRLRGFGMGGFIVRTPWSSEFKREALRELSTRAGFAALG